MWVSMKTIDFALKYQEYASYPFQFSPDITPMINQGLLFSTPFFLHTEGQSIYLSFDVLFSFESEQLRNQKICTLFE